MLWYGAVAVLIAHTENLHAQVWALNRHVSVSVAPVPGAAALSSSLGGLGGSNWWPPSTVGSQVLCLGNLVSTSAKQYYIAKQYKFLLDLETFKVCRIQVIFIWDEHLSSSFSLLAVLYGEKKWIWTHSLQIYKSLMFRTTSAKNWKNKTTTKKQLQDMKKSRKLLFNYEIKSKIDFHFS